MCYLGYEPLPSLFPQKMDTNLLLQLFAGILAGVEGSPSLFKSSLQILFLLLKVMSLFLCVVVGSLEVGIALTQFWEIASCVY